MNLPIHKQDLKKIYIYILLKKEQNNTFNFFQTEKVLFLYCGGEGSTPGSAQGLFGALYLGIIHTGVGGLNRMPTIKPRSAKSKESILIVELYLQFLCFILDR